MFPLECVLIGCSEEALRSIRCELAANDAVVAAEFPDVPSAVGGVEESGGPWLFLLHVREPDDLRQLQKLVRTFAGQPVLAVVAPEVQERDERATAEGDWSSSVRRASLFVQAMRAGAMQVVSQPLDSADFREALQGLAAHCGPAPESTVIAVSGVQGGCGATTLAINLAHAISEIADKHCVLVEMAPHAGMLAAYLNLQPECTLGDLLEREHLDTQTIKQALTAVTPRLSVLCGPYRDIVVNLAERPLSAGDLLSIIDALRRVAPIVVLDVPAWFDESYFEALRKADKLVLVTEQSVPAMLSLQRLERALAPSDRQTLDVLVNRFDPKVKEMSLESLKHVAKGTIHKLCADPAMVAAANEGRLLRRAAPHSRAAMEIETLAASLVQPAVRPRPVGFWNKMFGLAGVCVAEGG